MLRLADFLTDLYWELGYTSSTVGTTRANLIKRVVNNAYQMVARLMPADFLRKQYLIQIPAPYSTGTLTATGGSVTLTGSGTTWTAFMQMRQVRISTEHQVYFLRSWSAANSMAMAVPYEKTTASSLSYKVACWAIPLPNDVILPLAEDAVSNLDDNCLIPLIPADVWRRQYGQVYETGTPSLACVDGVTSFPRMDHGTVAVTSGNATVTCSVSGIPLQNDIGRRIWISGDSTVYRITGTGSATWTVSPVMQRATGTGLSYAIDPAPNPLLWFDVAPNATLRIQISYQAKPFELYGDDDVPVLAGDYLELWRAMSRYMALTRISADAIHKQEALAEMQMILKSLPRYLDTTPIVKWANTLEAYPQDAIEPFSRHSEAT